MIYIFEKIVNKIQQYFFEKTFFSSNLAFGGEYTLFAGLEECLKFVRDYKFHTTDIEYLRTILPDYTEDGFFDYLRDLDMNDIKIFAIPEGREKQLRPR